MALASTDTHASATAKSNCGKSVESPVVASDKLERLKVWGEGDPSLRWAGAFASCGGKGADAVLDHRLRDRAGRPSRLAHGRHRGDAIHHRRHRRAENGGRQHPCGAAGQRIRAADERAPRPRQHRQGDAARGRVLRGGDVHAGLRHRDAAAQESTSSARPTARARRFAKRLIRAIAACGARTLPSWMK